MKANSLVLGLGIMLLGGPYLGHAQFTSDERKSFEQTRARAQKGDIEAELALATLYANGTGVAADPAKAAKWHRKAAEQGSASGQLLLGLDYAGGVGVKPDKVEGARWIRKAAEAGLSEAQYDLAMCYANGDGVHESPNEAITWFRRAAAQGMVAAKYEVGRACLEGTGVTKDMAKGIQLLQEAAEEGFAAAQNSLGLCYAKGEGVAKDHLQAYKWFDLAAANDDEHATEIRVNLVKSERYLTAEQIEEAQRQARDFKPRAPAATQGGPAVAPDEQAPPSARKEATNAATPSAAPKTGLVNVKAEDESCEIFVDDAFVGNAPAKLRLPAGPHRIEVRKPGFKDYRKQLELLEGSELTLRAVLEKE